MTHYYPAPQDAQDASVVANVSGNEIPSYVRTPNIESTKTISEPKKVYYRLVYN